MVATEIAVLTCMPMSTAMVIRSIGCSHQIITVVMLKLNGSDRNFGISGTLNKLIRYGLFTERTKLNNAGTITDDVCSACGSVNISCTSIHRAVDDDLGVR